MPKTKQKLHGSAEIYRAYRLLFGRAFPQGLRVQELKPDALKRAFRRRALETHPDRFVGAGVDAAAVQQKFVQVSDAYRTLLDAMEFGYVGETKNSGTRPRRGGQVATRPAQSAAGYASAKGSVKSSAKRRSDRPRQYYAGPMPSRPLRLGEFLYYAGHISWQDLVASLVWQRQQRMRFGEIAQQWGMLSARAVAQIQRSQRRGERFGECALRLGELTSFQQMAVIGKQHMQRPLLGAFFVREGLLGDDDIALAQREAELHNANFRMARAA